MKTKGKVGFIDTNNKLARIKEDKDEKTNTTFDNIPLNNKYLDALLIAVREFIEDEIKGYHSSELRLRDKIEASRTLFGKERYELYRKNRLFGITDSKKSI